MGRSCFWMSRSSDHLCSRLSLQECLYSEHPWKAEIMTAPEKRASLFAVQCNKNNVSLWGKTQAGLLPIIKSLGSLNARSFCSTASYMCRHHLDFSCHPAVVEHSQMPKVQMLLLLQVMKSFVSDPGVSYLLSPSRKQDRLTYWLANRVKKKIIQTLQIS